MKYTKCIGKDNSNCHLIMNKTLTFLEGKYLLST